MPTSKFNEAKVFIVWKIWNENKNDDSKTYTFYGSAIVGSYKNIDPRCNFANCWPDKMSYKYRLY